MALEGSNAAVLGIVDRILRLTLNDQVIGMLPPMDLDQLQHRAQEAMQTLALSDADGGAGAHKPVVAAAPALCGLAVECVNIVERAELSTGPARLVATGCEVLAALLYPRLAGVSEKDGWNYSWIDETLEDLSDQIDFLALEVYCGLGRLEGAITESDALPVVVDPCLDDFGSYWGSIEHRQALHELSAWIMCVVFRALGYKAVTARRLMEFVNYDVLCLCSLLRGLLNSHGGSATGLPCDLAEIQGVAFGALCGLTAPELAFPYSDGAAATIEEQNRVLSCYLEVLCSAVVETGLLEAALEAALDGVRGAGSPAGAYGASFLGFLATMVLQADGAEVTLEDPHPPPLRLRAEIFRRADRLGSLLEAVLARGCSSAVQLKELLGSCVTLSAALAAHAKHDAADDGFTLACRVLLAACLERGCGEGPDAAVVLAALSALAANVEDLEISRERLVTLIGALQLEDRARARSRLTRSDRLRLPVCGDLARVLDLFGSARDAGANVHSGSAAEVEAASPPTPAPAPSAAAAAGAAAAAPPLAGLRDLVQNSPKEFRCTLDGKLLCDPVVSPGGVIFERSTLARWLQKHGPTCPITGEALRVEDCKRSAEIRKKVTEWVRGKGRQREPKKKTRPKKDTE
mmetsp:Transcript_80979/g.223979  ORF Transcript_80979/g.223979 Transcript_80979/m.223979 type:complete len:634 (-) Transcript_80979:117-2018(-)